ncbi:MAG: BACON domain-containing protein [Candidatus Aminicenantes bacterium]|nr:MAG: BACON domain-containing protein [Candidatus Aminicenantes bacterium]
MNVKKLAILFLSSLLLFSLNAFGLKNVSRSGSYSVRPNIAINQEGVMMVVWAENPNDKDYGDIYYRIHEKGTWQQAMNTGLKWRGAWTPMLAVDSDGNFHLGWADGLASSAREIFHSMYTHGSGWKGRKMIYLSPHNSSWPKIDIDKDRVHIAWTHRHSGYPGGDIIAMSKKISATEWPANYERISFSANDICNHVGFKARNDVIHICYMEGIGHSGPWRLRYKQATRGSNWKNVSQATLYEPGYYPELDLDHDDNVHVVWGSRQGNFYYKQKVGNQWRATEIVSNLKAPRQMGDIRFNNGVLVTSFVQMFETLREAYYCVKTPQGKWSVPVKLAEGEDARHPKVWLDNNAVAHFVWQDERGGATDIFYERVDVTPPDPFLQINPETLSFSVEGYNPDPANIKVKNSGKEALEYKVKVDQDWLSVTPASGKLTQGKEHSLQCAVDALDLDEGTYSATIEISSKEAINSPRHVTVNLEVLAPPIYPPLNFSAEVLENKALLYREYMHRLTWEPNPENRDIVAYTLYLVDGENYEFLDEIPSSTLEYTRRNIDLDRTYAYELWAVDDKGRTGVEPATLTVSGMSIARKNNQKNRIR